MIPDTIESSAAVKARGGFYTPSSLTGFMTRWAIRTPTDAVLEPSCGDGAFISAIVARLADLGANDAGLLGVEREASEAVKAQGLAPNADIRAVDFFDLDPADVHPSDAVVGNPPYIRYQDFAGADRNKALARTRAQNVLLSGLASSWAHFVVHATGFLKPDGRLALVVPAELLHTDYAQPVREFLLQRFRSVSVVAFDRMVFADAQVDAVLLLASNDDDSGLQVIRLNDDEGLRSLTMSGGTAIAPARTQRWSSAIDPGASQVYLDVVAANRTWQLGEFARVDIGFVSGANDFFVLSRDGARAARLPASVLTPAIRRPRDVPGLEVAEGEESLLLDLASEVELDPPTLRYLSVGVDRGVNGRYKARMRTPWYAVPLPKRQPDALIPYMAHLGPRLIVNRPGTRNSNLLHGVSLLPEAPPVRALSVAMCGSLSLLSAEIEGRAYGGGVLKLETKEAERLRIPVIGRAEAHALEDEFHQIDGLVRDGDIHSASQIADLILGVDHDKIWAAYIAFRSRRLGRRRDVGLAPAKALS